MSRRKGILVYGMSNVVGGIEKYLLTIQENLKDLVDFIYMFEECDCIYAEQIKKLEGEIVFYKKSGDYNAYYSSIKRILKKYNNILSTLYVNVSDFKHENVTVLFLARIYGYRIIVHSHAGMLSPIDSVFHRMVHKIIDWGGKILVSGKQINRFAVSNRSGLYLYGKQKFEILSPGIDIERFKFNEKVRVELRNSLNLGDKFVIGFVGRLVEIKNPCFAVEVLSEIIKDEKYVDTILLVVGDGPMHEKINEYIKEKGLSSNVIFVGEVDDVNNYMQTMDCMLGCSFSEGFPLVFEEAQTSGIQCICAENNYPLELKRTDWICFQSLDTGARAWADEVKKYIDNKARYYEQRLHNTNDTTMFSEKIVADNLKKILLR